METTDAHTLAAPLPAAGRARPAWLSYTGIALTLAVAVSIGAALRASWHSGDLPQGLYYLTLQNVMRDTDTRLWHTLPAVFFAVLLCHWMVLRSRRPRASVWTLRVARCVRADAWRSSGATALLWVLALNLAGRYRTVVPPGDALNVVLIVIDTLRADHVGSYGYTRPTTPHMDAFAADSVRFRRAYSSSAWTRPAVASILTSTTPFAHGITADTPWQVLPPSFLTLQEYLRNQHYWTAAILTNPHYRFGVDQNFDDVRYCGNGPADRVYDQALALLGAQRPPRFFLLIHNNDPHDSYEFHTGFSTTPPESPYRRLENLLPSRADGGRIDADSEANRSSTVRLDAAALDELKQNYDGEIAFVDHHLGRFIAGLRERGLLQRTIVVITADHGEEFLDHGSYWHGATLFEELIHVPLLLSAPGLGSAVIDAPVGTIDIFPTLVDLLGAPPLPERRTTGVSLLPLLRGGQLPPRSLVAATALRSQLKYGVIRGSDKLIARADGEPIGLFNLRDDPREERDLCARDIARCRRWTSTLIALAASTSGSPTDQQARALVDDATREHLRALGYGGK